MTIKLFLLGTKCRFRIRLKQEMVLMLVALVSKQKGLVKDLGGFGKNQADGVFSVLGCLDLLSDEFNIMLSAGSVPFCSFYVT